MKSIFAVLSTVIVLWPGHPLTATEPSALPDTLVFDKAEMAGISAFRAYWDKPVVCAEEGATRMSDHGRFGKGLVADWHTDQPGSAVFDAVNRSLLVRWPGAAETIAAKLATGRTIKKAEVEFAFVDYEYFPMDYDLPSGMSFLGDLWVRLQPRWHAAAWALRKPWVADPQLGPTFNAAANGRVYWGQFGAQDVVHDRFEKQFGPTEVSAKSPLSRMDVTPCLEDAAFGGTLAERLRRVADNGFLVRKWETYDALYNQGGYEYGGATGHRGIRVGTPKLIMTFAPGRPPPVKLPPAFDAAKAKRSGKPTAVMPGVTEIERFIAQYGAKQPSDMPDWQWQRVQELLTLSSAETGFPNSTEAYVKWVDHWLAMPYRMFVGHHTPLSTLDMLMYGDALPSPVREHMKQYWDAWLMPGRPYWDLQHNQWGIWTKPENSYYNQTHDWRGNHSFYRDSYTRFMSTMNFNHNAALAALLGGAFTDNEEAMRDGRFGLEMILLRLWSWYDGTTQESIDHYYLGLTLYGQKAFADHGPTEFDRMIGRNILLKTMDELSACYHPALRHFIATSGRTGIAELLAVNEGPNHILHTVSKKGALHDLHNTDRLGMPVVGGDCPPNLVGHEALVSPWLPLWADQIVDDKPLPYEMTAAYKVWGNQRKTPLWKRSYLGHHYGLATLDCSYNNETVPIMAQWRREPKTVENMQDLGTLLCRYGLNQTEFYDSLYHGGKTSNANGSVGQQGSGTYALQHKNKALILTSPNKNLAGYNRQMPDKITSLQTSIALADYQPRPSWKIFVDGRPLGALPAQAKMTSRITIHDGVTYVGIIPIPATNLGRTDEILITDGGAPVDLQGGGKAAPSLVINNYNYRNENQPFDPKTADWTKTDLAYGGFVIEMSDATEYPDFASFQQHIESATLDLRWEDQAGVLHVKYISGPDTLECGYRPDYQATSAVRVPTDQCFPYRRVNGRWPYLPEGMDRDTTLSQQGETGLLAKSGATLRTHPGFMAYLLTEPTSGNYLFSNPFPDPQYMVMEAPGGVKIKADGRLGLTQVLYNIRSNTLDAHYAIKPGQHGDDMAAALYVFGVNKAPQAVLNGVKLTKPRAVEIGSERAWRIPLDPRSRFAATKFTHAQAACETVFQKEARVAASMKYLAGQEHYLLTEPRSGAWQFWRMWPGESPYEVSVPGNVRVATDGNLALQRMLISPQEHRVEIDYAPYLQRGKDGNPIKDRAEALLVFGFDEPPSALLHGKAYNAAPDDTVTIHGETAYVIPLFGGKVSDVRRDVVARYTSAMKQLAEHGAK